MASQPANPPLDDKLLDEIHADSHTNTGIENKKLIMWLFLASDCMFFGTLISTHLIYRKLYPFGHPQEGAVDITGTFDIELTSFSTFILLMSSFLMALAVSAMHKGAIESFRRYTFGVIIFGLIFLGGQVYEFQHFFHGQGWYQWKAETADGQVIFGDDANGGAFHDVADAGHAKENFAHEHLGLKLLAFEPEENAELGGGPIPFTFDLELPRDSGDPLVINGQYLYVPEHPEASQVIIQSDLPAPPVEKKKEAAKDQENEEGDQAAANEESPAGDDSQQAEEGESSEDAEKSAEKSDNAEDAEQSDKAESSEETTAKEETPDAKEESAQASNETEQAKPEDAESKGQPAEDAESSEQTAAKEETPDAKEESAQASNETEQAKPEDAESKDQPTEEAEQDSTHALALQPMPPTSIEAATTMAKDFFKQTNFGFNVTEFKQVKQVPGLSLQNSVFGSTFYVMTGTHGTHVAIGVLWLFSMLIYSYSGRLTPRNAIDVEIAGLYWHFVDIVWIVIFTAVYLVEYIEL